MRIDGYMRAALSFEPCFFARLDLTWCDQHFPVLLSTDSTTAQWNFRTYAVDCVAPQLQAANRRFCQENNYRRNLRKHQPPLQNSETNATQWFFKLRCNTSYHIPSDLRVSKVTILYPLG
ncbi:hypothetical protein D918_09778 [Trichuris suis]|nr:hypothetical protein D918_09778 [Trichuris suis]